MIQIEITDEIYTKAKNHYEYINRRLNKHTFAKDSQRGNMYGALGEIIVQSYYKDKLYFPAEWNPNYDLLSNSGKKIDVKTKGITKGIIPKPEYNVSVAANNGMGISQECDWYVFCHISSDYKIGWIDGWLSKTDFLALSTLYKKGTLDPESGRTPFYFPVDTHTIHINKLKTI
jgi:hypothetical protein